MKYSLLLFLATVGALLALHAGFGWGVAYVTAYGAIVLMAAMISATFFWLWIARATPLALGMAFSWAGTASVLGWWWLWQIADRPEAMSRNAMLFGFVALYVVGAVLHFHVIERSMSLRQGSFAAPVLAAIVLSALAAALF